METKPIERKLVDSLIQRFPKEAASVLETQPMNETLDYLSSHQLDTAIEVLLGLSPQMVSGVVEQMDDALFSKLFSNIDPYNSAIILSRLKKEKISQKLSLLPSSESDEIQELLNYPPSVAGYLMDTRIITMHPNHSVEDVLIRLRNVGDTAIAIVYVTDIDGRLLGSVSIQVIAISSPEKLLSQLLSNCYSIHAMAPQEDVVTLFEKGKINNLPVVDMENKILGIIRNEALIAATQKDATSDVLAMFGAGKEERALSSPWIAVKNRLPWLQINLVTAFLAASIVGIFEDTIAQITVLAVFLPVVAGQSGNTGSQALAVTMRGLALREIQAKHWWKVAKKEVLVGFVNGVAVALTTSTIVYFWASSFGLALVLGISMIISMVIAGFSGAVVPIVLKSFGQDPAQSSSIVLTTVTDIMGFLSFLGLATLLGSALGIL